MLVEQCQRIVGSVRKDVKELCLENENVLEWAKPARAGSFIFPKLLLLNDSDDSKGNSGGACKSCDELLEKGDIMLLSSFLFEYGELQISWGVSLSHSICQEGRARYVTNISPHAGHP
jgi:hypothetical protein